MDAATPEGKRNLHVRMRGVVEALRLPFASRSWTGKTGNWLGVGIGTSIDFQDHRPYLPGDDPRYIDWLAYARTGQFTMKLYREEVSPSVDLVLDGSASMSFDAEKFSRAMELFYFSVESALHAGAALRCSIVHGRDFMSLPLPAVLGHHWELPEPEGDPETVMPTLTRIPFRHGSLRVFISDLLYPGSPDALLKTLCVNRGRGILFAPFTEQESNPRWDGNVEFIDCETKEHRRQRIPPQLLDRYRAAYHRHFDLWQDLARKYDVPLARIPHGGDLLGRLFREALPVRAVETWT